MDDNAPANTTNLFEALALAHGQDDEISTVFGWARERFEVLSLEERYARLLNVHFSINPRVPQEKVDADLAKLAKSTDTQAKYDILCQVLTEQADAILSCEDDACAEELEIPQAAMQWMTDMFKKMNKTMQETIDYTNEKLRFIKEIDRFYDAQIKAESSGLLFPSPPLPQ